MTLLEHAVKLIVSKQKVRYFKRMIFLSTLFIYTLIKKI
ncbi:hypothetical protein L289_2451 [Acinetobacter gerneri DSM 14967 = CIP 107464 = MTCC 9824]|nr:hypothetical protein L289_2451 [Acinetobacter gerneri DSM 14967 = CIP 107464 = MTCC 9824]